VALDLDINTSVNVSSTRWLRWFIGLNNTNSPLKAASK